MNCVEVNELIQRDLDNDLDENEHITLKHHLELCSECSTFYERLRIVHLDLESLPKVSLPYSLVDTLLPEFDRIDQLTNDKSSGTVRKMNSFFNKRWFYTATAVAASLFVIFSITQLLQQNKQEQFVALQENADVAPEEAEILLNAGQQEMSQMSTTMSLPVEDAAGGAGDMIDNKEAEAVGMRSLSVPPQFTNMAVDPNSYSTIESPDQKTVAIVSEQMIELRSNSEQQVLLTIIADEGESIVNVEWIAPQLLQYESVKASETLTWVIDTTTLEKQMKKTE